MDIFIDSINGKSNNNGSIDSPLNDIIDIYNLTLSDSIDIYLMEGSYNLNETFFSNLYNTTVKNIKLVGDAKNTIITISPIYPNLAGVVYDIEMSICKCIVDIIGMAVNKIMIRNRVNFYNVLFRNIDDDPYGLFLPLSPGDIYMYNCIKLTKSNAFIRTTNGKAYVYNSYGAFTSGYMTTDNMWNTENNVITYNTNVDEDYRILDEVDKNIGLYTGLYPWEERYYLIRKGVNYYNINNDNYDLLTKGYNNLTINGPLYDLFKNNGFLLQSLFDEVTIEDETFKPIEKFNNFNIVKLIKR